MPMIQVEVSDTDVYLVKQQAGLTIQSWTEAAIVGKINQARKLFQREWYQKLIDRSISIPANEDEFIAIVKQQPNYVEQEEVTV